MDLHGLQHAFRLVEGKGAQMNFMGNSVVQSSMAVDDVLDHPRGGTAANNQQYMRVLLSPSVPKMAEGLDKARPGCVETR